MDDTAAATVSNPNGKSRLLLVCEHASNFIPDIYHNLDLPAATLQSHAAWDIGALELAQRISQILDAPLVSSNISRLVYDCNRLVGSPGAIPETSEIYQIPANRNLSHEDIENRYQNYYLPFEQAISACLENFSLPPLLITVHSFTPVYHGQVRAVDIGMVCDSDEQLARHLVASAADRSDFNTRLNEPYGPGKGVTHTLGLHGSSNGLLNTMIEVKNSLLASREQIDQMAQILSSMIIAAAIEFDHHPVGVVPHA